MNYSKLFWTCVFVVLLAAMCSAVYRSGTAIQKEIKTEIQSAPQAVSHKSDKSGVDHASIEDNVVSPTTADIVYGVLLDSIAKINRINAKQIVEISTYKLSKSGSFKGKADTVTIHDTLITTIHLQGDNFTGEGEIKNNVITGSFHLNKIELNRLRYWKKKWLLGTPRFYEDLSSADTTIHIDSMFNIRIKEAEFSRWSLGAFVGYDVINQKMGAGVALNFDLLRFKKRVKKQPLNK